MPTFRDANDREWTVAIDPLTILDIRADGDPDFLKGDPSDSIDRLNADPVLLCGVIWVACREQAKARSVDQKGFYMSVIGDAIDGATQALLDAIVLFSPRRERELLTTRAAKNQKMRSAAIDRAMQKINDPELEARVLTALEERMDAEIDRILTPAKSASNSVDSSA